MSKYKATILLDIKKEIKERIKATALINPDKIWKYLIIFSIVEIIKSH